VPTEQDGRAVKQGAVLYDTRGNTSLDPVSDRALCHVVSVFEEVGTGDRLYNVWDGTHTYQEFVHEDRLLEDFELAGWTFPRGSKPLYHLTRNCGVEDPADLMTDGGEEVGRGGPPCPTIECGNCGREHHYDAAGGICSGCAGFLRDSTEEEDRQFAEFLKWNSGVVSGGEADAV